MKRGKTISRLSKAIAEMAADQQRLGIMDGASYRKITIRHLAPGVVRAAEPISGEQIRALRERAHMSQTAFARCLNLTPGYVSQLERGVKPPTGPALALLNVIRRNGLAAIL